MKIAIDVRGLDKEEVQIELFERGYRWGGWEAKVKHFAPLSFIICNPSRKSLSYLSDGYVLLARVGQGTMVLRTLEEL